MHEHTIVKLERVRWCMKGALHFSSPATMHITCTAMHLGTASTWDVAVLPPLQWVKSIDEKRLR